MKTLKNLLLIAVLLFSFTAKSQCGYDTLSVQISHINCFEDNTGGIDLIVPNVNASFTWDVHLVFQQHQFLLIHFMQETMC